LELSADLQHADPKPIEDAFASRHLLDLSGAPPALAGSIFLVGSGPGSPSLLTRAAYDVLTKQATVVLSDKLVPAQVLALIPPHVKLTIAKKFPGNAEGAQSELMELALEAAKEGHCVVRLKQGDVFLYGRGGEEVLYFRQHGYECTVIPGLSSTLAVPAVANIPVTQRGVAESVIICTGVGRGGKGVRLPGYQRERTLVVLMGVARLAGVVHALTSDEGTESGREGGEREGPAFPKNTPMAILERGSSPDQRVISSTLEHIVEAMDSLDEQRAPGMMVIGWSVMCLANEGFVKVLDSSEAELDARAQKWLGGKRWLIAEGMPKNWVFD
jgi:uroporphyrin-III C-methyltransferase